MGISEAIAKILINFSNQYPFTAGVLIIAVLMRPFSKAATTVVHKKVEKRFGILNNRWIKLLCQKWYFKLILWTIDVVFSIKIISEKQKEKHEINKDHGQYDTKKNL